VEVLSQFVVSPDGAQVPVALLQYRVELKTTFELRDDERAARLENPDGSVERLLRRSHVEHSQENADTGKRPIGNHGEGTANQPLVHRAVDEGCDMGLQSDQPLVDGIDIGLVVRAV